MVKSYDKKIDELNETIDDLKWKVEKLESKETNRVTINKKKNTLRVQIGANRYEVKLPEDAISLTIGSTEDNSLEQSRKNSMEMGKTASLLARGLG